jgi:hypothetical protein
MMEGAGVPVPIIQLLIGHSRKATMGTTAIYSQGERVNLRQAINKLRYPRGIMRLLRAAEVHPHPPAHASRSARQGQTTATRV